MSQPQRTTESPPPPCPAEVAHRASLRRRRRIIGYTILAILVLPPLADVLSDPYGEVADWYYAAALENYESGHRSQAEANLEDALRWSPENPQVYVARARWAAREERYEDALAEINKAIEVGGQTTPLLIERSEIYQHLKRYDEAVDDWEQILAQTEKPSLGERIDRSAYRQRRANVLNAVAYAQSLGKIDLPLALERITKSLEFRGNPKVLETRLTIAMKLDTRGYIHYLLGNYEPALADLNKAVEETHLVRNFYKRNLDDLRRNSLSETAVEQAIANADEGLAVMFYHRGLVHEAMGNDREARADFDRVRAITGREPGEWLF